MLEAASRMMRGGCMMVMQRQGEEVVFRGTAFVAHSRGFLLTASDVVRGTSEVMVVPDVSHDDFAPLVYPSVTPYTAAVVQVDENRSVALLKLESELNMVVPDSVLGRAEDVVPGNMVLALGYSYGFQRVHGLLGTAAVISSKVRSANETNLILYDRPPLAGDVGGPLVNAADARVVGIIGGPFDPQDVSGDSAGAPHLHGYAISVEYGAALLAAEGLPGPGAGA